MISDHPSTKPVSVVLDWKQYFKEFSKTHGDNPVEWRGQLLFHDGWRYEMRYEGPEHPPPEDKAALRRMQYHYWHERRRIVRRRINEVEDSYNAFIQQAATRSIPLVQSVVYITDDEDGKRTMRRTQEPFDVSVIAGRLQWMKQDLEYAEQQMRSIVQSAEEEEEGIAV